MVSTAQDAVYIPFVWTVRHLASRSRPVPSSPDPRRSGRRPNRAVRSPWVQTRLDSSEPSSNREDGFHDERGLSLLTPPVHAGWQPAGVSHMALRPVRMFRSCRCSQHTTSFRALAWSIPSLGYFPPSAVADARRSSQQQHALSTVAAVKGGFQCLSVVNVRHPGLPSSPLACIYARSLALSAPVPIPPHQ